MKLLRSDQMREVDRRTIKEIGLPGVVLMENAGAGVTRLLKRRFPAWQEKRLLILCGPGNNGGDGFVIARRLMAAGAAVRVLLFGIADRLQGDALLHHGAFIRSGGRLREITEERHLANFQSVLGHAGLVVDALFGTGLQRPLEGVIAQAIRLVNDAELPVLAVDIPSGVCADSGRIRGVALKARWTVTFAAEKCGHRLYPGAGLCGEITNVPIGIPTSLIDGEAHTVARNLPDDLHIPERPMDGHKGRFGHLLILAGSVGKEGAAALTALGAQRTGPGLVTVATPQQARPLVAAKLLEAMTLPLPDQEEPSCPAGRWSSVIHASGVQPTALAMGPGLGQGADASATVPALMTQWGHLPAVIDADGLNILALQGEDFLSAITRQRTAPLILTPHPGEMARLLGRTVADIQADRLDIACQAAQRWQVWLVLKGPDTIIAAPDGRAWINDSGNSGLAAGGSGDLLTGVVAGLLTQHWPVEVAVRAGVWLHGTAADDAVEQGLGEAGLLAGDLLPRIHHRRNQWR